MELPARALSTMNRAVDFVNDGDMVSAAIQVDQAKMEAKSGMAVAKAIDEMMGTILDLVA
jgi:hypothetical protein